MHAFSSCRWPTRTWIILSIVVSSQCTKDSTLSLNYSISANVRRFVEASSTVTHLHSTVTANLSIHGAVPEATLEPLSYEAGLYGTYEGNELWNSPLTDVDGHGGLPVTENLRTDPDIPGSVSDLDAWLSGTEPSYLNRSDTNSSPSWASLQALADYEDAFGTGEILDSEGQLNGAGTANAQASRYTAEADGDVNQLPLPSGLVTHMNGPLDDEAESVAGPGDEQRYSRPRQHQPDLSDLWIQHQRRYHQLQPEKDLYLRERLWRPDDEPEPPPGRSRGRSGVLTAVTAAATISFLTEEERRRKRETSAGSAENLPPQKKVAVCEDVESLSAETDSTRSESPPPRRSRTLRHPDEIIRIRTPSCPPPPRRSRTLRHPGEIIRIRTPSCPPPPRRSWTLWDADMDFAPTASASFVPLHVRNFSSFEGIDCVPLVSSVLPTRHSRTRPIALQRRLPFIPSQEQSETDFLPNSALSDQYPYISETNNIIFQPDTRPITQEQLVAEVKGIYASLVEVETRCIEFDNEQTSGGPATSVENPKVNNEEWQASIALHRTLLHEHHDFLIASQHPSASSALRYLAAKYAMPTRMWRHGIHSFLELLKLRLPASLDYMVAFVYLAYSMMALLYETVPAFEDTWIECLGALGGYRMAIEGDDIEDREVWTGVARHWYSKASKKPSTTGRLYHHLAILSQPNTIQQLSYYSKRLDLPILTGLPDNLLQRIADFLPCADVVRLSQTCHKLCKAYLFVLAEGLDAFCSMPSSAEVDDTLPSAVMEPLETTDNWLLQFISLDLESADRKSSSLELVPLQEYCSDEQPRLAPDLMLRDLLGIPNDLTVMISAEDNQQIPNHNQHSNSDDEIQSLENEAGSKDFSEAEETTEFGGPLIKTCVVLDDGERKVMETPSMTDPTTINDSSEPKSLSPSIGFPSPSRSARGAFTCTQCSKSFPLMCALRKHAKYHTKNFPCSVTKCARAFSTRKDLTRHEKGVHKTMYSGEDIEECRCHHPECRGRKPFSRKDNLMRHLRGKKHHQNKFEGSGDKDIAEEDEDEQDGKYQDENNESSS